MSVSRTSLIAAIFLVVSSTLYALPWASFGFSLPGDKGYKLGLDLHGGVELDYKIDFSAQAGRPNADQTKVIEGLKRIVERRVNSIGTAEPTILSASYGQEKHIIVQIPTRTFDANVTPDERARLNLEFLRKAKETIGKVVRLEFKEEKTSITAEDKKERRAIIDQFIAEIGGSADPFATVAQKYRDQFENLKFEAGTGTLASLPKYAQLPKNVKVSGKTWISAPFDSSVEGFSLGEDNAIQTTNEAGYSVVRLSSASGADLSASGTIVNYEVLFVSAKPSAWTPAKSLQGQVLDERYLVQAASQFDPNSFQYVVSLRFNDEGAKIFADITKRMIGHPLAIFVGGQMLTAPRVNSVIPNGQAVITGQYTQESAAKLANDINTGIVPAPIYLTSEQTIDPKLGIEALNLLLLAGIIGFVVILIFLTVVYRVAGLISGLSLVAYVTLTLALVKLIGVVMTLAAIAGLVLSIGIAIDANILMLERAKEELRAKQPLAKALRLGLERSWSAIWDSNITGLIVALILWVFGVSIVQSFGIMLALGILTSLVAIRWIAYPITVMLASRFENKVKTYLNI